MAEADTLHHPTLKCSLRGKPSTSTVQFRNVKFATIPGRWQDSVLNDVLPLDSDGVYDATRFGPSCPHKRGAQAWDLTLVGDVSMSFAEADEEPMSEFDCLHVNVTVPKTVLEKQNRNDLPVFVWVHGGGLSFGSNNWPQYNLTRFVERSVEIGKPVIGVAINYRIGILGYLASEELGIRGNFGYKDQVVAFHWIKKHIAGFGGNPDNITASGESAGGISLSTLLCANTGNEALFKRVVIMSGDATLRKSRDISWHNEMYHDNLKFLGLDQTDVETRKKQLKTMGVTTLADKLPFAQYFCGCIDGDFLQEEISPSAIGDGSRRQHKPEWCEEFVIGDVPYDGTVLHGRVLANPQAFENLKKACAGYLSTAETSALLSAYDLPAAHSDQQNRNLLELMSDLRFYLPAYTAHSGWKAAFSPDRSSRYHFHVPNPIKGAFTGLACHEFDLALLLQNFFEHFDEFIKHAARQMTDQWIRFTCEGGWGEKGKILVIGQEGLSEMSEADYDRDFRKGRGEVLDKIGVEKCWLVAEAWQGVRPDKVSSTTDGP